MKYSAKGIPPDCLGEFIRRKSGIQLRYKVFKKTPCKKEVHDALLAEQCFLCAYCGREIVRDESSVLHSHIEHFDPADNKELHYNNMYASCGPGNGTSPKICGEAKSNSIIASEVNPSKLGIETKFSYGADGTIGGLDAASQEAIKILNLDDDSLKLQRSVIIKDIDPMIGTEITKENWEEYSKDLTAPDVHGKAPNFAHVIRRYIETEIQYLTN